MKTNRSPVKNLHLLISAILILVIGVTYGFAPELIVPALASVKTGSPDISNAFKAIMGLYLGMATVWVWGIVRPQFWYAATVINILFTLGLAFGRLISLAIDGIPSGGMLGGLILESLVGLWGIISLRTFAEPLDK